MSCALTGKECQASQLHSVPNADFNKNGEARRKFTQQLQENEMVLQVSSYVCQSADTTFGYGFACVMDMRARGPQSC